jgi:hypothetical protein
VKGECEADTYNGVDEVRRANYDYVLVKAELVQSCKDLVCCLGLRQ